MSQRRDGRHNRDAADARDAGSGARLRARRVPGQIDVWRPHGDDPILIQNAEPGRRPFIHPIVLPGGEAVLTADPVPDDPSPPALSVGLADVNGVDFWNEAAADAPLDGAGPRGTFHPLLVGPQRLHDGGVLWSVITDWRGPPDGASLLGDSQRWTMTDLGHAYRLDLLWTLSARVDLEIGQSPLGGLSLRVPWRREHGGTTLNSEGRMNDVADRPRARWLATSVPLPGGAPGASGCGIVMMDHPANAGHPVAWRADESSGIGAAPGMMSAWMLAAGELIEFRYRLFVYAGETDVKAIEAEWAAFTRDADEGGGGADDAADDQGRPD